MRNDVLIQTENVKKGLFAIEGLKKRHLVSPGRSFLVLQGLTGRGKTSFLEWYAVQTNAAYLEADPDWTSSWLMRDLAEILGLSRLHSLEENKRQIREAQQRNSRLIILDEADRVIRSGRLLETVRGLHDAGIALVLAGEAGAWGNILRKSPRFADRVCQVMEFGDVSAEDVQAAAEQCADLRLSPETAALVRQRAEGNFRRAAKILEEMERVCKANSRPPSREMVALAVDNLQIAAARKQKRAAAGSG